jgi:hypothetical protein
MSSSWAIRVCPKLVREMDLNKLRSPQIWDTPVQFPSILGDRSMVRRRIAPERPYRCPAQLLSHLNLNGWLGLFSFQGRFRDLFLDSGLRGLFLAHAIRLPLVSVGAEAMLPLAAPAVDLIEVFGLDAQLVALQ